MYILAFPGSFVNISLNLHITMILSIYLWSIYALSDEDRAGFSIRDESRYFYLSKMVCGTS